MAEEIHAGQAPEPPSPEEKKAQDSRTDLYYWLQALVVALVSIILIFTFVVRIISVVGTSMVPTLHDKDMLLVQSIGYAPKQGDIVVLTKESFMDEPIVKRIIALGGQTVEIDYDAGTVTVDGQALDEPYIKEAMRPTVYESMTSLVVPEGSVFVMGDNRNGSSDSRSYDLGPVDERYIIGRVLCVLFPVSNFGLVG